MVAVAIRFLRIRREVDMRRSVLGRLLAALLSGATVGISAVSPAATINLSLSGKVGEFSESQSDVGGLRFDQFELVLSGLDASNAIAVSQGDTVNITVTLDDDYWIPASELDTPFIQSLTGVFPPGKTDVSGVFNLLCDGMPEATIVYDSSSLGQLRSLGIVGPDKTAIEFDSFTNNFTIGSLASPATLVSSSFSFIHVSSSVPELSSWAMMLLGFAGVGCVGYCSGRKPRRGQNGLI
jgi:hypothetical protein